jgi:hypothetical protein
MFMHQSKILPGTRGCTAMSGSVSSQGLNCAWIVRFNGKTIGHKAAQAKTIGHLSS